MAAFSARQRPSAPGRASDKAIRCVAVEDVSFGVAADEVFGFLGPNGVGKTTAVRMLATLIAPGAGTARVAGISLWG
jgi:ABC-type multidrug transport system ATPase subunit